jgi:hypothetical protein
MGEGKTVEGFLERFGFNLGCVERRQHALEYLRSLLESEKRKAFNEAAEIAEDHEGAEVDGKISRKLYNKAAGLEVCPDCSGRGWTEGHGPNCASACDQGACPVQVECERCHGTGEVRP